jgi:hypothetical protein
MTNLRESRTEPASGDGGRAAAISPLRASGRAGACEDDKTKNERKKRGDEKKTPNPAQARGP